MLRLKIYPNGIGSKPLENIAQNIVKWSCVYIQGDGRHSCMFCVHSCMLYFWIETIYSVFYFDTTLNELFSVCITLSPFYISAEFFNPVVRITKTAIKEFHATGLQKE
jgi:hypothetical protein